MKRVLERIVPMLAGFGCGTARAQSTRPLPRIAIDMKTAKAPGFSIPQSLLVRADEVIQ